MQEFLRQVKRNCDISDARHWGYYSICGLLLRLRELYAFEHGLRPWERVDAVDIASWIGRREELWERLSERGDYVRIKTGGGEYGPFDIGGINAAIVAMGGLYYGAGYGEHMKPVFFVAALESVENIEGYEVRITGKEYVRDLTAYPAMHQSGTIIARKEAVLTFVWEKFEEFRSRKSTGGAMDAAFAHYGVQRKDYAEAELLSVLTSVAGAELRSFIRHEIGEAHEGERLGKGWVEMLFDIARCRASLYLRAVKDMLSDTSDVGTLKHIISDEKAGSLAFFVSSLNGPRKALGPEVSVAFERFQKDGNWAAVQSARLAAYGRAARVAGAMLDIYDSAKGSLKLEGEIERVFTELTRTGT